MTENKKRARRADGGFTLVEALIAVVVMSIGTFSLLAVFPQALDSVRKSGNTSILNHLASAKVEELRLLDYADTDLDIGTHPSLSTDGNGKKYYAVSG